MVIEHPSHPPVRVLHAAGSERVTHGDGAARSLFQAVQRLGGGRALVVTGPTIAYETELLWYIEQLLGPLHAGSYTGVRAHVPAETVEEAAGLARDASADLLVSLGGGSAIDTAKAVAQTLASPDGTLPPQVALPTTLSAAEHTAYAGVTGTDQVKRRIEAPGMAPREVILDPRLTLATPAALWLSSGIKALDHATESYLCSPSQPVTDLLAVEAARILFGALPACADDPAAIEPRADALVAAWLSMFSPLSTRRGLSHALGHQLGAAGVPHGVTSCVTLPAVLRWTYEATAERQRAFAAAIGVDGVLDVAVARLVARLGLPARLRDTSLDEGDLAEIAERALDEAQRTSPRPIESAGVLGKLLREMW